MLRTQDCEDDGAGIDTDGGRHSRRCEQCRSVKTKTKRAAGVPEKAVSPPVSCCLISNLSHLQFVFAGRGYARVSAHGGGRPQADSAQAPLAPLAPLAAGIPEDT